MKKQNEILILDFSEEHSHYFGSLNKEWIQKSYMLEAKDLELLDDPRQAIIDTGGAILFASYQNEIIGTVGIRRLNENQAEMIKLAVKEEYRGLGAGKLLCLATLQKAEQMGVDKMVLYSNTLQETAIGLYRKLGFVERPVEQGVYARANIKMEYSFPNRTNKTRQQSNWFERRFEFNTSPASFKPLAEKMARAPRLIHESIIRNSGEASNRKYGGKWSVKEHLGHLSILEPLWRLRFQDIQEEKQVMEFADLSNGATHEADFNNQDLKVLCDKFQEERGKTLDLLSGFSLQDLTKTSLHPRLNQLMNCCDLMLFIAEHDLHHLNHINDLLDYD